MPTTPVLGLPYPSPSDPADGPGAFQALAEAIDSSPAVVPVGAIMLWAVAAPPANWLFCNGAPVPVEYPELLALMANTPDLRGRVPAGFDASQGEFDALLEPGGAKTVTLEATQLPGHTHPVSDSGHGHAHTLGIGEDYPDHSHVFPNFWNVPASQYTFGNASANPGGTTVVGGAFVSYINGTGIQAGHHVHGIGGSISAAATGISVAANTGGGAHPNLPPYLTMQYVIRAG